MRHHLSRHQIVQCLKFSFLISYFDLFIFLLPATVLDRFLHQTKLLISPFKWNISLISSLFVARDIIQKILRAFVWATHLEYQAVYKACISQSCIAGSQQMYYIQSVCQVNIIQSQHSKSWNISLNSFTLWFFHKSLIYNLCSL